MAHVWKHIIGFSTLNICSIIYFTQLYKIYESEYPTKEEFLLFIHNLVSMHVNAEQYCVDNRQAVPATGIENLRPCICDTDDNMCSVCMYPVMRGQSVYILPCGHVFHGIAGECLEDSGTIINWLRLHPTCPNCITTIYIPP